MTEQRWHNLGPVAELQKAPLQQLRIGKVAIALSFRDGRFGVITGRCNHVGGPLGHGRIRDDDYIVCPRHYWAFHRLTGAGEPGYPDAVPRFDLKEASGELWINLTPATKRVQSPHNPHALARDIVRAPGGLRVAGISTTAMTRGFPRYSTSEDLLQVALDHAAGQGAEARLLRLNDLRFRSCEGFYSKCAAACTWPCSITRMDDKDELTAVNEALVFWADVVLVATPIRWGNAGALYFKMIERLNCIQNEITTHDRVLIRNKVAGFIVTGGQDNVQAVAGEMLMFFGELGFLFLQFPFIAHSRGWSAEDMENNMSEVRANAELRDGARALAGRCLDMAAGLVAAGKAAEQTPRGGRKSFDSSY